MSSSKSSHIYSSLNFCDVFSFLGFGMDLTLRGPGADWRWMCLVMWKPASIPAFLSPSLLQLGSGHGPSQCLDRTRRDQAWIVKSCGKVRGQALNWTKQPWARSGPHEQPHGNLDQQGPQSKHEPGRTCSKPGLEELLSKDPSQKKLKFPV